MIPPDGWTVDPGEDWPAQVNRLLLVDQTRNELLATITPPAGMTPRQAIRQLETLDRLFAMLPPGQHPIPVN